MNRLEREVLDEIQDNSYDFDEDKAVAIVALVREAVLQEIEDKKQDTTVTTDYDELDHILKNSNSNSNYNTIRIHNYMNPNAIVKSTVAWANPKDPLSPKMTIIKDNMYKELTFSCEDCNFKQKTTDRELISNVNYISHTINTHFEKDHKITPTK